jgi:MFS family permease
LLPFYLIHGRSFSPSKAGLILTAQPFVMAIIAPLSGWLSDRINPRWLTTSGMAILSIGLWQLAQLNAASSIQTIVIALATAGFGTGMFASPNNSVLMGAAPGNRQGIAAGILATARNVGMVLGVGMAGAIYTTLLMNNSSPASQSSNLFNAIHWSFLASVIVAVIGVLFSWLRANPDNQ